MTPAPALNSLSSPFFEKIKVVELKEKYGHEDMISMFMEMCVLLLCD